MRILICNDDGYFAPGIEALASVLSDACPDARHVALDPIPEIGSCGPHDLVSVSREAFVGLLDAGR